MRGIIEFGERDWGKWVFQFYHPHFSLKPDGFLLIWDFLTIRIDPAKKAYGLVLFGFGVGAQKAKEKPEEES